MAMQTKRNKIELRTIVQTSLFPAEVEQIKNLRMTADEILKYIADKLEDGIEFSFLQNTKSNGHSVLVKDTNPSRGNAGTGFYSNGPDLKTAILVAIFKLEMVGDEGWESFFGKRSVQTGIS